LDPDSPKSFVFNAADTAAEISWLEAEMVLKKSKKAVKRVARRNVHEIILPPISQIDSMDMPSKIDFLKSAIASQQITLR
jgi:hypothetical protein